MLRPGETLATAVASCAGAAPDLRHARFSALTVRHAVADACRASRGDRPDVELVPLAPGTHGRFQGPSSHVGALCGPTGRSM